MTSPAPVKISQETILTAKNVNSAGFGKLFTSSVDGIIDAQPLYLSQVPIAGQGTHNVVYAVTENDSVYAFDADNGSQLWHVSLLQSEKPLRIVTTAGRSVRRSVLLLRRSSIVPAVQTGPSM